MGEHSWKSARNPCPLEAEMLILSMCCQVNTNSIFRYSRCLLLSFYWKDADQPTNLGCDWLLSEFTSLELLLKVKILYCRKVADLGVFSVELEEHIQKPTVCKFINWFYLTQKSRSHEEEDT